ncbi:hypothetical protein ACOME3_010398 [Neoechinorhynchus agilis]
MPPTFLPMSAFRSNLFLIIAIVFSIAILESYAQDKCSCAAKCQERSKKWNKVDQTPKNIDACKQACAIKCKDSKDGNVDFTAEPELYYFNVDEIEYLPGEKGSRHHGKKH